MTAFFRFCMAVLGTLSLAILLSLREPNMVYHQPLLVQKYLNSPEILSLLVEKHRNRTSNGTNEVMELGRGHIVRDALEKKDQKFDRIIKKMEIKKEKGGNKFVKRNRRIQEKFSKRLDKIEEYCEVYENRRKTGKHDIKPRAPKKGFSLGKNL